MLGANRIARPFLFLLTIACVLFCIVQATAQQGSPVSAPAPSDSQTPVAQDSKNDPGPNAPSEKVGKSKIEQETGTINDRIFEVMPNYGTVEENPRKLKAMTTGQKFRLATASVFDWGAYPFNALLAAVGQANNDPEAWGQGWGAYGKRYGAAFADNSIGSYMTVAIYPSLLHEDPRYYEMGQGKFSRRFVYGWSRLFVVRTDAGHDRFNYSEWIGNASAAAMSNIYHPADERTAARNATTFGFLIFYDGISNELREFWPDIRRKVFHKKNP
jgi:hypothetical protein